MEKVDISSPLGFMGMRMALHFTSLFPAYPPRIYVTEPFAKYVCATFAKHCYRLACYSFIWNCLYSITYLLYTNSCY